MALGALRVVRVGRIRSVLGVATVVRCRVSIVRLRRLGMRVSGRWGRRALPASLPSVRHCRPCSTACEAACEESGDLTAILCHIRSAATGASRMLRAHALALTLRMICVWSYVVRGKVDVGQRAAIVAETDDAIRVKVAVEVIALAAAAEEEEDKGSENRRTCDTTDDSTDDCSCMRG